MSMTVNDRQPLFTTLHHVCIVVWDVDKAVDYYRSIGVGPWVDYPPLSQYTRLQVPDPASFATTRYKFADLANIQLQLCQPGPGESPQRRHLEKRGEGVFHLGFSVPDCDHAERSAAASGLAVLMSGRRDDGSGFTYFDTADRGAAVVLEVRSTSRSA